MGSTVQAAKWSYLKGNLYFRTTLSGTPGGGKGRFLGGGPRRCDLLSNRHSPIFP